jgi:hypothetical protein
MAKKKSSRPKKLRLVDNSSIGLTNKQLKELSDLYRHCGTQDYPSPDSKGMRRIPLERLLYIYIELLCHDASVENSKLGKHRAVKLRRETVDNMSKLSGRSFSPNDIIKALSSIAPLPEFAAAAIRRDFLRIPGRPHEERAGR